MISVRSSNKKKKKVVDTSYLACKYLALMAGSVGDFIAENSRDNDDPVRCLLIGLGGGALASFLSKNFGNQERRKFKTCLWNTCGCYRKGQLSYFLLSCFECISYPKYRSRSMSTP